MGIRRLAGGTLPLECGEGEPHGSGQVEGLGHRLPSPTQVVAAAPLVRVEPIVGPQQRTNLETYTQDNST